jgi:endonuclease YncB( thermonuclease family)
MPKAFLMKAIAAIGVIAAAAACEPPPSEPIRGRVSHIVDGDTFFIDRTRIRLCGIDAPEQGKPGYRQSAKFLQQMIQGKDIRCVPVGAGASCPGRAQPQTRNRVVAQCFLFGTDVADEMVKAGHAKDWRKISGEY